MTRNSAARQPGKKKDQQAPARRKLQRPSFFNAPQMSTTTSTPSEPSQPGPSNHLQPCTVCNTRSSKYTCPRCQTKTCSLPCSRQHKSSTGCSGERDQAAYVPMNEYGYAALVNDYVFLEEMGRKVEGLGRNIVQSGIIDSRGSGRGAADRRGRGKMARHGKDRKSILAVQLGVRDIDMDILPVGMKRAGINKSLWDFKGKRALLTLEFVFQPPPDPLTRQEVKQVSILTHRENWDQSIRQIIRRKTKETKGIKNNEKLLRWLSLDEEDESIPSSVLCLMKRPRSYDDPLNPIPSRPSFYKLDWNEKLSRSLRHKHFVEFPSILLVDESSFDGVLVHDDGFAEDMRERQAKRRKLDPSVAKKTIKGLLGSYGSDEEVEPNALDTLAGYSGSEQREGNTSGSDSDATDEVDGEPVDELPDVLDEEHDASNLVDIDEGEALDWGDDEIAEDEAKLAELSASIQQQYSAR